MNEAEIKEASWQCNGSMLFVGGCKSGQTTFDVHPGTKAWRCNQHLSIVEGFVEPEPESVEDGGLQECDYDLCEMCVRWAVHCEKTGTDHGLVSSASLPDSD